MSKIKSKDNILLIILLIVFILIVIALFKLITSDNPDEDKEDNTTKEKVSTTKKKEDINVNLTIVGDFLFEDPFIKDFENNNYQSTYFNRVKHYFDSDDISIGNMEVPISDGTIATSGDNFNFCAPKEIGSLVNTLDLQVLSTANNHTYDRNIEGIKSTLDFFKNNTQITTVGTNDTGISTAPTMNINDINIGFLAYTYGTNQKPLKEKRKYINYYRDIDTKKFTNEYKEKIKNDVESLKEQVDVVIVIIHWGTEFTYKPNAEQKEVAKYLNSLGVDLVIGSHSHCIQPIEELTSDTGYKTLVYYSLGNFVSADDDISRTPKGQETFDNAYQVGLLSTLTITKNKNGISINNIKTEPIVNYFDKKMQNFELIPFKDYDETYEKNHLRYSYGLTNKFIKDMYESVIDSKYRQ